MPSFEGEHPNVESAKSIKEQTASMSDYDRDRYLRSLTGDSGVEGVEIGQDFVIDEGRARAQAYNEKRTQEREAARGDGWFADKVQDLKDWCDDNPNKAGYIKSMMKLTGVSIAAFSGGAAFGHPEVAALPTALEVWSLSGLFAFRDTAGRTPFDRLNEADAMHQAQRDWKE